MSYSLVNNLKQYQYFIRQQTKVILLNDFKKSFLGSAWLFITPLLTVVIWVLLHSAGILNPGDVQGSYPAFVLVGTTLWSLFFEMYWTSSRLITGYGNLMIMKNFPIEALIVALTLVNFIRFFVLLVLTFFALLFMPTSISPSIIIFPVLLLPLALMGLSLGLFASLIRVVAADIANVMDMCMKVLLFLTPVIYAPNVSGKFLHLINTINPITYLIGYPRDQLFGHGETSVASYLATALLSILFFTISLRLVRRQAPFLLERIILS